MSDTSEFEDRSNDWKTGTWPQKLWREAVGETIREARTERGDRLTDIAERAGVSTQYLSEIERGLKDPSSEVLHAVSGALDLTTREVTRRSSELIECATARLEVFLAA